MGWELLFAEEIWAMPQQSLKGAWIEMVSISKKGLSNCLSSGMIREICRWHLRSVLHWGFIPTPASLKTPFKHGMLDTWGLFKASSSCLSPFLGVRYLYSSEGRGFTRDDAAGDPNLAVSRVGHTSLIPLWKHPSGGALGPVHLGV